MKSAKELWAEHRAHVEARETQARDEAREWAKEWLDEKGELVSKALIEKGSFDGDALCKRIEVQALCDALRGLGYEADYYDEQDGYEGYRLHIFFGDMDDR